MLSRSGRPLAQKIFGPVARLFVRLGISANTVTVLGTLLSIITVLVCFPLNHLILGVVIGGILVIFDNLDGQIARMTGTQSAWGAFLDSSMDRFSDSAIFVALILWGYFQATPAARPWMMLGALLALIFSIIVSYVRARAEGIGYGASIGIAERADRLVLAGVCIILVGFGLSDWILVAGMWILAALSFITIMQRMWVVYKQTQQDAPSTVAKSAGAKVAAPKEEEK